MEQIPTGRQARILGSKASVVTTNRVGNLATVAPGLRGCGKTRSSACCSAGILPARVAMQRFDGWKPALRRPASEFFRSLLSPACRPQGWRYNVQPIPGYYTGFGGNPLPAISLGQAGQNSAPPMEPPKKGGPQSGNLPILSEARMFMITNKVSAKWSVLRSLAEN